MGDLSIARASEHDVDRVMTLIAACIADMRKAGIEQWDDVYPDRPTLLQDARDGTLYLASVAAEPLVGVLVVNSVQSPEYSDVSWTIPGARIAVVHRLMIDPRYQRHADRIDPGFRRRSGLRVVGQRAGEDAIGALAGTPGQHEAGKRECQRGCTVEDCHERDPRRVLAANSYPRDALTCLIPCDS